MVQYNWVEQWLQMRQAGPGAIPLGGARLQMRQAGPGAIPLGGAVAAYETGRN